MSCELRHHVSRKSGGKALAERKAKMENPKTNYAPKDIADDLWHLCDELLADTEATLAETKPEDFDADEWGKLREAIADTKKKLAELDEAIERKEAEAEDYDPETDENRYATYWD